MIGLVDKYINSLIVSISPILEVRGKISYAKFQHKRYKFSTSGMQNVLDEIYSQIDMIEEMINDLENISIEPFQNKIHRGLNKIIING